MQKEHGVNSTQLLYAASPYMAAILAAVALPLDVGLTSASSGSAPNVFSNDGGSTGAIVFVASLTCVIAVLVNFSTFLVIGKCDAVTYQVLGHLKTVLVLAFGFFALGDPMSFKNVLGIGVALLGMVAYGAAETAEKRRASSTDSSSGVGGVESLKGSLLPTTTKG
jgi:solute carrier family 35 protein E3